MIINLSEAQYCIYLFQAVQYHQLKSEADYISLGKKVYENTQSLYRVDHNQTSYEVGRIFYLSIPPSAYTRSSRLLHEHVRPQAGRPWVRMVLEKPFGQDLASAKKLDKHLHKYFSDHEIYRVDHYLGKTVVRQILPFR